jgi:hypothetical protein
MRHQPLDPKTGTPNTTVAAVWPSFQEALLNRQPLELEQERPEFAEPAPVVSSAPAAPDVPAAVGGFVVASYVALLAVFFAFFAGSPLAFFSITICAVFVTVFFAVPRIFFAVEADPARRPSLSQFMHGGIQTLTGRTGGKDALIQMLIVPVFLGLGLLTMGIIGKIYIG